MTEQQVFPALWGDKVWKNSSLQQSMSRFVILAVCRMSSVYCTQLAKGPHLRKPHVLGKGFDGRS